MSLNIPEKQVLLEFPPDVDGVRYHHRVLFFGIREGSWVLASPEGRVGVRDLSAHGGSVIALAKGAALPRGLGQRRREVLLHVVRRSPLQSKCK